MRKLVKKRKFERELNYIKEHRLFFFMLCVILIKQLLMLGLPIFAHPGADHDDGMMVKMADSLLKGEWLGSYSEMTLVKGVFFPAFLAVNSFLGIPYSISVPLFYSAACVVFIYGLKKLFKTELPLYILFIVLMFNPISFGNETFARVYRNCLVAGQVLFITGGMIGMYLNRFEKDGTLLLWSLIGSIGVASLWHSREDGMWIIPLTMGVIILTGITVAVKKELKFPEKLRKIAITLCPVAILIVITIFIASMNYAYYGIYTTNELNDSNFTKTIKSMYAVVPDQEIHHVSVPRSSMEKLYEASPTLNGIHEEINSSLDRWSWYDKDLPVREVEDGWFFWAIREAVANSGYYRDAQTADQFYAQVNAELEDAFATGKLQSRATLPSALLSPWRDAYWEELPKSFIVVVHYVAGYEAIQTSIVNSIDDGRNGLRLFEHVTNNLAQYPGEAIKWSDQLRIDILNAIQNIYQAVGVLTFLLAGIGYGVITVSLFKKKWRQNLRLIDFWLVLSGLLWSAFVLEAGVAYTDITASGAISYWYLAGAYPLFASFCVISIYKVSDILFNRNRFKRTR